jgi:hypothetical protein
MLRSHYGIPGDNVIDCTQPNTEHWQRGYREGFHEAEVGYRSQMPLNLRFASCFGVKLRPESSTQWSAIGIGIVIGLCSLPYLTSSLFAVVFFLFALYLVFASC